MAKEKLSDIEAIEKKLEKTTKKPKENKAMKTKIETIKTIVIIVFVMIGIGVVSYMAGSNSQKNSYEQALRQATETVKTVNIEVKQPEPSK